MNEAERGTPRLETYKSGIRINGNSSGSSGFSHGLFPDIAPLTFPARYNIQAFPPGGGVPAPPVED